jgi:fructose-1-phosphate kinase PfkB-like protein
VLGGTFDGRLREAVPAGKGVNTARSLRRLLGKSGNVTAAAWLGRDDVPFFAAGLGREKIGLAACPRACATRIATTFLEAAGRETHVKEHMPTPSAEEARALRSFCERLPLRGACAAVCGSAPNGTPRKLLAKVLAALRKHSHVLIADTNGPFLEAAGRAGLDGIKGNAEEIGTWLRLTRAFDPKREAHRQRLMEALAAAGTRRPISNQSLLVPRPTSSAPSSALVTLGSAGAVFATREGLWHARPPKIPKGSALSATGCGDAATAGWMWALADGCGPSETVCRAVACGTAKLLSADPGGLDRASVKELLKATKVENLY